MPSIPPWTALKHLSWKDISSPSIINVLFIVHIWLKASLHPQIWCFCRASSYGMVKSRLTDMGILTASSPSDQVKLSKENPVLTRRAEETMTLKEDESIRFYFYGITWWRVDNSFVLWVNSSNICDTSGERDRVPAVWDGYGRKVYVQNGRSVAGARCGSSSDLSNVLVPGHI